MTGTRKPLRAAVLHTSIAVGLLFSPSGIPAAARAGEAPATQPVTQPAPVQLPGGPSAVATQPSTQPVTQPAIAQGTVVPPASATQPSTRSVIAPPATQPVAATQAVAPLAAQPPTANALSNARERYQRVFAQQEPKSPRESPEFAATLLRAAQANADDAAMRRVLFEKAYESGLKHPDGLATALAAAGAVLQGPALIAPAEASGWRLRRVAVLRQQYARSAGDARNKIAAALLPELIGCADALMKDRGFADAAKLYAEAERLPSSVTSARRDLPMRARRAQDGERVQARAESLRQRLRSAPDDPAAAREMATLQVAELHDLDAAAEAAAVADDEPLRRHIVLARTAIDLLDERQCLEIAGWYASLAAGASTLGKPESYARAAAYYDAYASRHAGQDAARADAARAAAKLAKSAEPFRSLVDDDEGHAAKAKALSRGPLDFSDVLKSQPKDDGYRLSASTAMGTMFAPEGRATTLTGIASKYPADADVALMMFRKATQPAASTAERKIALDYLAAALPKDARVLQLMRSKILDRSAGEDERQAALTYVIANATTDYAELLPLMIQKARQEWATGTERQVALIYLSVHGVDDRDTVALMKDKAVDAHATPYERRVALAFLSPRTLKDQATAVLMKQLAMRKSIPPDERKLALTALVPLGKADAEVRRIMEAVVRDKQRTPDETQVATAFLLAVP